MTTPGRRVSVIGFGYVGLRLAVSFGRRGLVVGFDIDRRRVAELAGGFDRTGEVDAEELSTAMVAYTTDPGDLDGADFHVVAVPTAHRRRQAARPRATCWQRPGRWGPTWAAAISSFTSRWSTPAQPRRSASQRWRTPPGCGAAPTSSWDTRPSGSTPACRAHTFTKIAQGRVGPGPGDPRNSRGGLRLCRGGDRSPGPQHRGGQDRPRSSRTPSET